MKVVYDAADSIEAHLLKGLLQVEGIGCYVSGDYLRGGIGELPAVGLARVWVEDEDYYRARKLVENWQNASRVSERETEHMVIEPKTNYWAIWFWLMVGVAVSMVGLLVLES